MYKPKQEIKQIYKKLEICAEKWNGINPNELLKTALEDNERLKAELNRLNKVRKANFNKRMRN